MVDSGNELNPNDIPDDVAAMLGQATHPNQRSAVAETLLHAVNTDYLKESMRTVVNESPLPEMEVYAEHGSFRSQEALTEAEQSVLDSLIQSTQPKANSCYRNAQLAAISEPANADIDVRYAEGVVASEELPNLVTHAWIEINDKVADITFDVNQTTEYTNIEYFGVQFGTETVSKAISERETADPLALFVSEN